LRRSGQAVGAAELASCGSGLEDIDEASWAGLAGHARSQRRGLERGDSRNLPLHPHYRGICRLWILQRRIIARQKRICNSPATKCFICVEIETMQLLRLWISTVLALNMTKVLHRKIDGRPVHDTCRRYMNQRRRHELSPARWPSVGRWRGGKTTDLQDKQHWKLEPRDKLQ
jgi:hypothetical protein